MHDGAPAEAELPATAAEGAAGAVGGGAGGAARGSGAAPAAASAACNPSCNKLENDCFAGGACSTAAAATAATAAEKSLSGAGIPWGPAGVIPTLSLLGSV